MPDGILPPTETTAPELAAETADSRLLRHVRRNLVLWSGGTTLLILIALAIALYVAAASSLASAGITQLDARMATIKGERPDPDDPVALRLHLRWWRVRHVRDDPRPRRSAGPRARAIRGHRPACPTSRASTPRRGQRATTSRRPSSARTPVRILTETVGGARSAARSRSRSSRTGRPSSRRSQVIQFVLIVGGLLVLVVSFGFGTDLRAPGAGPDPRVAGQPADRAAPPARVRGRREPRAADAADGHPEQRRAPRATPRRAGRGRSAPRSRTSTTRSAT